MAACQRSAVPSADIHNFKFESRGLHYQSDERFQKMGQSGLCKEHRQWISVVSIRPSTILLVLGVGMLYAEGSLSHDNED